MPDESEIVLAGFEDGPCSIAVAGAGPDFVGGDDGRFFAAIDMTSPHKNQTELVGTIGFTECADQPLTVKFATRSGAAVVDRATVGALVRARRVKSGRHLGDSEHHAACGAPIAFPAGFLLRHPQGQAPLALGLLFPVAFVRLSHDRSAYYITMNHRAFGRDGPQVSEVGLGCWQFGGTEWGDVTEDAVLATLRAAADSGIRFFDTA